MTYTALTLWYGLAVPIWEAPDEPEHLQYVNFVANHWRIPETLPTINVTGISESHQPPLYYFVLAGLTAWAQPQRLEVVPNPYYTWPGHDAGVAAALHRPLTDNWPPSPSVFAGHVARAASALWGVITIVATYRLAQLLAGSNGLAMLAVAAIAFLPGFVFGQATVNNDAALLALSSVAALAAFRCAPSASRRELFVLSTLLVVLVATKLSGALIVAAVTVTLLLRGVSLVRSVVVGAPSAIFAVGWFIKYGWVALVGHQEWTLTIDASGGELAGLTTLGASFIGVFGWLNVAFPAWVYAVVGLLLVSSLVGLTRVSDRRVVVALAVWPGILLLAILLRWGISGEAHIANEHARYLYPALPALGAMYALSWSQMPRPWGAVLAVGVSVTLLVTSLAAIPLVVRPAYAYQETVASFVSRQPDQGATPSDLRPTADLALAAYAVAPACPKRGDVVRVSLFWQAVKPPLRSLDTVVLLDGERWPLTGLSQRNPGGLYASTVWQPDEVVRDDHQFWLGDDLPAGAYVLRVGTVEQPDLGRYPKADRRIPDGPAQTVPLTRFVWDENGQPISCS